METIAEDVIGGLSSDSTEFRLLTTPGYDVDRLSDAYKHVWTISNARPGKYSFKWWAGTATSRSEWREWDPDVVLSISSAAATLALRSTWRRKLLLSQCHGTASREVMSSISSLSAIEAVKIPLNIARIFREQVAYRLFSHIASIGPGVTRQLTEAPLFVDPSRIVTIPNAVDAEFWRYSALNRIRARQQLRLDDMTPLAMFSGRLHRQKGADLAIKSLAYLADTSWHLLICGEGTERDNLMRLGRHLGVSDRLHFTGRVDRKQLSCFLSAADLFVFPTRRHEGLPMNALEALASGLPVLTVQRANLPSDVCSNVIFSNLDPHDLAEQWSKVTLADDRRCQLPENYEMTATLNKYRTFIGVD